jgi:hypothetical protein
MTAGFVVAMIVVVAGFGAAMIALGRLSAKWAAEQANFEASLAKNLPQDVQAEMKPGQLGCATSMAIIAVFLTGMTMFVLMVTGKVAVALYEGIFIVLAVVALAAWTAAIARTWLERRHPGEVLVDLSPYPLAGAVRRSSWLGSVTFALMVVLMGIPGALDGHWMWLAVWVAFLLISLLAILMYSDRVWLAQRGFYLGGRLYPWEGFERVAWTDDGRAFALRRSGRWPIPRWTVVPVPEGSRGATEQALRKVLPAHTPTL